MKKKSITYSELSKKQIQFLKDLYIQKKVDSMDHKDLKNFVLDIISHQINDTIGKEEEIEVWEEISNFFGEQFETIILEIQTKYNNENNIQIPSENNQKERMELLEKNKLDQGKTDMWDD